MRQLVLATGLLCAVGLPTGIVAAVTRVDWSGTSSSSPDVIAQSGEAGSINALIDGIGNFETMPEHTGRDHSAADEAVLETATIRGTTQAEPETVEVMPRAIEESTFHNGIAEVAGGNSAAPSMLQSLTRYTLNIDIKDPAALYTLACSFLDPTTATDARDIGTGITYLKAAAGLGEAYAARDLGDLYSAGAEVERDNAEAYLWYSVAAEAFTDAEERATAIARGKELAAEMSPSELNRARSLVRDWRPDNAPTPANASGLIMVAGNI